MHVKVFKCMRNAKHRSLSQGMINLTNTLRCSEQGRRQKALTVLDIEKGRESSLRARDDILRQGHRGEKVPCQGRKDKQHSAAAEEWLQAVEANVKEGRKTCWVPGEVKIW